jgi:hypothetical protein
MRCELNKKMLLPLGRREESVSHNNKTISALLATLDLGASVAEQDSLLESSRIETSAFSDLLSDRVDLVPGTKGSGKSALFRIFVEFLPNALLRQRKVVVAHGVNAPGDPVFHAFAAQFAVLSEEDFVVFWHIYLVSLAHEQFIKDERYTEMLKGSASEVQAFRVACMKAGIPEIAAKKSLKSILEWALHVLSKWRPKLKYKMPHEAGEFEMDLFGNPTEGATTASDEIMQPTYLNEVKDQLEAILTKSGLSLWLMVDRLDEIFVRRSEIEKKALRALLRAMRFFSSSNIRLKIFLRDDMLDHLVNDGEGFTALTHVTVRKSDTLRWTSEQLLTLVVKRLFAHGPLANYLKVDTEKIEASAAYRKECFDKIFPHTVFRGPKQSKTLNWIYNRCADGRGVVTPRDVLDLLISAKQRQVDLSGGDIGGSADFIIGSDAIVYGLEELSKRKRQTYLQAEFPHLWNDIERLVGGKSDYGEAALANLLGLKWRPTAENLAAIGFFEKKVSGGKVTYIVPRVYRHGMEITQGKA